MLIEKIVKIIEEREEIVGYQCDNCKEEGTIEEFKKKWFSFTKGHHSWGNDSCESIKNVHCCCFECFMYCIQEAYEENKTYNCYIDFKLTKDAIKIFLDGVKSKKWG